MPQLERDPGRPVNVIIDGRECVADAGDSAAAAAIRAGMTATRQSPATGQPRAPYCLMGVCFECLMTIDGQPSVQACLVKVRPGMRIDFQKGAVALVG